MFFVLSKILHFFILPLTLIFLALIAVFVFKDRKHTRALFGATLLGFYLLCLPLVSGSLMGWLEGPRPSPDVLVQKYDVAVVLSGMLNLEMSTEGHLEFQHSAQHHSNIILLHQNVLVGCTRG